MSGELKCSDCSREIGPKDYLTEINPPGGYGREAVRICDDCMRSGRWDGWKNRMWPTWPEPASASVSV